MVVPRGKTLEPGAPERQKPALMGQRLLCSMAELPGVDPGSLRQREASTENVLFNFGRKNQMTSFPSGHLHNTVCYLTVNNHLYPTLVRTYQARKASRIQIQSHSLYIFQYEANNMQMFWPGKPHMVGC